MARSDEDPSARQAILVAQSLWGLHSCAHPLPQACRQAVRKRPALEREHEWLLATQAGSLPSAPPYSEQIKIVCSVAARSFWGYTINTN